jgi:hypothetical protein
MIVICSVPNVKLTQHLVNLSLHYESTRKRGQIATALTYTPVQKLKYAILMVDENYTNQQIMFISNTGSIANALSSASTCAPNQSKPHRHRHRRQSRSWRQRLTVITFIFRSALINARRWIGP